MPHENVLLFMDCSHQERCRYRNRFLRRSKTDSDCDPDSDTDSLDSIAPFSK